VAIVLGALAVPVAAADGPALSVPEQQMQSALHCTGDLTGSARTPVLLVHGTLDQTVSVKFSRGYERAVNAAGGEAELVEIEGEAGRHRDRRLALDRQLGCVRGLGFERQAQSGQQFPAVSGGRGQDQAAWT